MSFGCYKGGRCGHDFLVSKVILLLIFSVLFFLALYKVFKIKTSVEEIKSLMRFILVFIVLQSIGIF